MLRTLCAALCAVFLFSGALQADDSPVYELRKYVCEPGKLSPLQERFRNHTVRIFEKHGIKNIAYWTPTDGEAAKNTLIYVLEHKSREAARQSWDGFRKDPEWKKVAAESAEKHGKILSSRPESTYMTLTDYSASTFSFSPDKTYELRVYTTNDGKLSDLHTRFRDHTVNLFAKHGLKSVAYFSPLDQPLSKNTLIYVLETPDREAATAGWKGFLSDPDWQAAYKASTENGKLLSEKPVSIYMKTTDFSPLAE